MNEHGSRKEGRKEGSQATPNVSKWEKSQPQKKPGFVTGLIIYYTKR